MSGRFNVPLQNDAANMQTLAQIQAESPTNLQTDADGTLYFLSKPGSGKYAYASKQSILKIEYFMEYEQQNSTGLLKKSAAQIMIWNRLALSGLTSRVFFDYMLHDFDTMISNEQQSIDGQRFWLRQLRETSKRGFKIGMLDGIQMHNFDPSGDFDAWLQSLDGWGQDGDHGFQRFFITKIDVLTQATP